MRPLRINEDFDKLTSSGYGSSVGSYAVCNRADIIVVFWKTIFDSFTYFVVEIVLFKFYF